MAVLLTAFGAQAQSKSKPKPKLKLKPLPPNVVVDKPIFVQIDGVNNQPVLDNIKKYLKLTMESFLIQPIDKASIDNIYHNVPYNIEKAAQPYGYFQPKITSSRHYHHKMWKMQFKVALGARSKIRQITVRVLGQGAQDPRFIKTVKNYKALQGKYFDLDDYSSNNSLLLIDAANLGYFKARFVTRKMHIDIPSHSVNINVVFSTGKRHHIGLTDFSHTPFSKKFLMKYVTYHQGQYYNAAKSQSTHDNFAQSQYFSQVVVTPNVADSKNGVTPMRVLLKMRPQRVWKFGLGYNTDTQLRGLVGFKYRWVNRWGHYINSRAQASFVDYNIGVAYHIPWPNPMKDLFTVRAAAGKIDIRRGDSESYVFSALYKHLYTHWQHTFSLNYLNERYDMYKLPRTRAHLLYPDANISYFSTSNRIDPMEGVRLVGDLSATPNFLSSKSGFERALLGTKAIYTFFGYEQVMARLEYGRIGINHINNLPMTLQFLIGGTHTVRGYSYQSIGPGRNMLYGTVEFRQRLWKQLYIAGFYDFGNVTDNRIFGNVRDSAGPSILYRSPIGVIQLSIPWRLAADHVRPRIVFSIGPEL